MKQWMLLASAAYVALAAGHPSKGYLGIKVINNDENENGLGGSKRPRRQLDLTSKKGLGRSPQQRTNSNRIIRSRRTRGGTKHVTEIFVDDDSETNDDITPLDDDYSDDYSADSVVPPHKRKGMGKMDKKTKKYDIDYKVDDFFPRAEDIGFVDDQFFDDKFFEYDDCKVLSFNETFGMSSADLFNAPDTTHTDPGDPYYPGTVFLFEREYLLQPDGTTSINGTVVSGSCTRTEGGQDSSGAGLCNFVFIDDEGYSVNVNGLLVGPLGSKLAISGGTGALVGVVGDMDFLPIYEDSKTIGDIFMDPIRYDVMARLGLTVCP